VTNREPLDSGRSITTGCTGSPKEPAPSEPYVREEFLINIFALIFFLSISTTAYSGNATSSLCSPDEEVVFSCSCSNKTVSLCATKNLTADSGKLTYRYGTSKKVELEYPTIKIPPAKAFTAHFEDWAHGSISNISFTRGEYKYTVYNRTITYEVNAHDDGSGVEIYKNGKLVKDIWCKDSTVKESIWEKLHDIGLPETK